jgi:hypothetical protein
MGKMADVAPETVRAWYQKGVMTGPIQTPKGWEIDEDVFRAFLATRAMPKVGISPPTTGHLHPTDQGKDLGQAIHLLEIALTEAHSEIRSLREQVMILLQEDRDKGREIRALEAEMRALLQGERSPHPTRWVKAGPPREEEPQAHRFEEAEEVSTTTQAKEMSIEKPKGTTFARECLRLSEEGRTPEEIAKILGKPKQSVIMALRSCK